MTFTLMAAGGSVLAASSKRALACAYELMSERRGAVRWLRQRVAFRREAIISCGAGDRAAGGKGAALQLLAAAHAPLVASGWAYPGLIPYTFRN